MDVNFNAFIQEKEKQQWKLHGIMVTENGVVKGQYGDCKNRYPMYSATKTITSTAVGIAVDENKFTVEESLYYYIKDHIPVSVPQDKIELTKKVSIERLLSMSVTELPFRPEGDDWVSFSLESLPREIEKAEFHYSNLSAYLVGVALQCALSHKWKVGAALYRAASPEEDHNLSVRYGGRF